MSLLIIPYTRDELFPANSSLVFRDRSAMAVNFDFPMFLPRNGVVAVREWRDGTTCQVCLEAFAINNTETLM